MLCILAKRDLIFALCSRGKRRGYRWHSQDEISKELFNGSPRLSPIRVGTLTELLSEYLLLLVVK